MKKLIKVVRVSAKEWFIKLRDKWEIYCKAIDNNFIVSNLFFRHISWASKNRKIREIIERLSIINLVEKIWTKWELVELRKNIIIEENNYKESYKIKFYYKKIDFYIILAKREDCSIVLISAFLNYEQK